MPFLGTTGGGSVKQYGGQANLGYFIKNSLRFRASVSAYLNRTPAGAGSQTTWTWSGWIKFGKITGYQYLFGATSDNYANNFTLLQMNNGTSDLAFYDVQGGVTKFDLRPSQLFRDPAAWYHIVLTYDSSNATSSDRVRMYVNGSRITAFSSASYPTSSQASVLNSAVVHNHGTSSYPIDGYLAEVNFIDGQALTPSSFGKTDAATGQWIPKKFASTYGTNGFYLKFADASAATAAAIGKDSSPNGNNFTPNNISVTAGITYDAMIDSPTLSAVASNYPTLNPLDMGTPAEPMSAGNLNINGGNNIRATMACPSTGKWYFEYTRTNTTDYAHVGIFATSATITLLTGGSQIYRNDGQLFENNSSILSSWASYTTGDVIGVAVNCDTSQVSWYKNNTLVGTRSLVSEMTSSSPIFGVRNNTGATASLNFGQRAFTYTPPSGFKSLNAFNLP